MKLTILTIYICLSLQLVAQNTPEIDWIKTYETVNIQGLFLGEFERDNFGYIYYNDLKKWTKLDIDGNKIVHFNEFTDSTSSIINSKIAIDSNKDIFLTYTKKKFIPQVSFSVILKKISSNGEESWNKEYIGSYPTYVILDNNENPILGYFNGSNVILNGYSNSGDSLWSKSFEGFQGMDGLFLNNDNIYFSAWKNIQNTDPIDENHFLYKLNSEGELIWYRERTYLPICFDHYSNIIFREKGDFISKIDPEGNFLWRNDTELFSSPYIKVDNNNNTIVVGSNYDLSGTTARNYMIKKISKDGFVEWVREFNSPDVDYSRDEPLDFVIDSDNSIYITGRSVGGETYCYTLKYSENGKKIYQFNLHDEANTSYSSSNIYLVDNGYFLCGTSNNTIYLAKINDSNINKMQNPTNSITHCSLNQNYPNPFNPRTVIKYSISKKNNVKIEVFDLLGRAIKILVNDKFNPGTYDVEFDATELPSGVYYYQMTTDNFRSVKKSILLK